MKNPQLQLSEAIFEISRIAYETDETFKEVETQLIGYKALREMWLKQLKYVSPTKRAKRKMQLDILGQQIEEAEMILQEYLKICLQERKVEIENPNQEKLDAAFAKADVAHERLFLVYKHLTPHLLEDFTKIATDCFDSKEKEEFFVRVAKREATELEEILASVKDDGTTLRP